MYIQNRCFLFVRGRCLTVAGQYSRGSDQAYYERRRIHKAYYSLGLGDGIEKAALYHEPSPQEIYEKEIADQELYAAMLSTDLSKSEGKRADPDAQNKYYNISSLIEKVSSAFPPDK